MTSYFKTHAGRPAPAEDPKRRGSPHSGRQRGGGRGGARPMAGRRPLRLLTTLSSPPPPRTERRDSLVNGSSLGKNTSFQTRE